MGVATSRRSCGLVAARFPCRVYNRAAICAVSILSLMIAAAVHVPATDMSRWVFDPIPLACVRASGVLYVAGVSRLFYTLK